MDHSFFTKNVYYVLFYFLLDVHTLQRFSSKYIQFLVQLNEFIHHQLWFSLFIVLDRFRIMTTLDPTLIFLTIIIKTEKKQWKWSDRKSTKNIKQRNDMRNTIHIKSQDQYKMKRECKLVWHFQWWLVTVTYLRPLICDI